MWLRKLSNYLLAHPYVALLIVFLLTASTVIDVLKIMPLVFVLMLGSAFSLSYAGLVTLINGELIGAGFFGAMTVPYLIKLATLFWSANLSSLDWMMIIGIVFSCLLNVLTWATASMLYRGYTWSALMQGITLLGIFAICLIYLLYPGVTAWWVSILQKPFEVAQAQQTVAAVSGSGLPSPLTPEAQKQLVEAAARVATGMMVAGLIFCALLQVMISRWWQAFLNAPSLLVTELAEIRLSRLTGFLFASGVLLSSLGDMYPELNNDLVTAIMPVAYLLFLLVGLILVHYFFGLMASKPARIFWIFFFYIFFIWMAPFSLVLVAMVALFDIWIDFRKRFKSV